MHIFYFILILTIPILGIEFKKRYPCKWKIPRYIEHFCAVDKTCNFYAANREVLNREICRRRQNNNKKQFLRILNGKCPALRKICLPTYIRIEAKKPKQEVIVEDIRKTNGAIEGQ